VKRRAKHMRYNRAPGSVAADVLDSIEALGGQATVMQLVDHTGRNPRRVWDALQRLWRRRLVTRGPHRHHRDGSVPRLWTCNTTPMARANRRGA
jgi:hypothetical protein